MAAKENDASTNCYPLDRPADGTGIELVR